MNTDLRRRLTRRFVARLCDDVVDVLRMTETEDGRGGQTLSWRKVATYKARLLNRNDTERLVNGGIEPTSSWGLLVDVDADIRTQDRVVVPSKPDSVFEVSGSDTGQTNLLIQHVDLQERTI